MSLYIGVMSGTSVDGIDTALLEVKPQQKPKLIAAETHELDPGLQQALHQLIKAQHCSLSCLGDLNMAVGDAYAKAITNLLLKNHLQPNDIMAIGSHGQTICHAPQAQRPFSIQIGDPNFIAEKTGITCISDFRQRDMVCGGQGAPLVPAFHQIMFGDQDKNRVIVNVGGISNLTILSAYPDKAITGFDTGPGNTLMDGWIRQHQNKAYDQNGHWASMGTVDESLLALMLEEPFFSAPIPKSSGRERFHSAWLRQKLGLISHEITAVDVQATLLALTSKTIAQAIIHYAPETESIYLCGGGAHNTALLKALQKEMPFKEISDTEALGLSVDYVEACAFAWLAHRTLHHQSGNVPSVTGASRECLLGGVYWSSNSA